MVSPGKEGVDCFGWFLRHAHRALILRVRISGCPVSSGVSRTDGISARREKYIRPPNRFSLVVTVLINIYIKD